MWNYFKARIGHLSVPHVITYLVFADYSVVEYNSYSRHQFFYIIQQWYGDGRNFVNTRIHMAKVCLSGTMMTSSNGTFSALLPFVWGIHRPPVKSLHKGQWRAELCCFIWSALNKRLSKLSCDWWFETQSRPLWCHCNARRGLGYHVMVKSYKS